MACPPARPEWHGIAAMAATANFSSSFFPLMKSCHLTAHLIAVHGLQAAGRQSGRPSIVQVAQVVPRAGAGHIHCLRPSVRRSLIVFVVVLKTL